MVIIGDFIDLEDTKRPNKNLILVSTHMFKLVIVAEYFSKIYLPSTVRPNNIYGIFPLFFINNMLDILVKNINKYKAPHY